MNVSLPTLLTEIDPSLFPHIALPVVIIFALAYGVGSIPCSYLIVRAVTGTDITERGTGNVGAMNVRRSTGSWAWFTIAMLGDAAKGFVPVLAASTMSAHFTGAPPASMLGWDAQQASAVGASIIGPRAAVIGAVIGHNYSLWLTLGKRRILGGKGLATGGGALLAYDWRYLLVALAVGLLVIAATRYMMAGQVSAAIALPLYAIATNQPDVLFVVVLGGLVYARHHRRFLGMLKGKEPRLYVDDGTGPRG